MANASALPASFSDPYALVPNALVIAARPEGAALAGKALEIAGARLLGSYDLDTGAAALADHAAIDLILVEAEGADDDALDALLARADAMARERRAGVVAAVTHAQIDVAAAQLFGPHAALLCAPGLADRVLAIALALPRGATRLHDATRDAESIRLQRLNEEVARFADTLARLTRGEDAVSAGNVRDSGLGYRGPEVEAEVTGAEMRAAIRSRRLRAQHFAEELFADPAWDMLLDLFAAELEHRRVSVSSLCIAAAVPPTTALRWIGTMHEAGLFERHADPVDRRRAYIALSAKALAGMRNYIAAVKRAGLAIV